MDGWVDGRTDGWMDDFGEVNSKQTTGVDA